MELRFSANTNEIVSYNTFARLGLNKGDATFHFSELSTCYEPLCRR